MSQLQPSCVGIIQFKRLSFHRNCFRIIPGKEAQAGKLTETSCDENLTGLRYAIRISRGDRRLLRRLLRDHDILAR
jgi:hypothetical protein